MTNTAARRSALALVLLLLTSIAAKSFAQTIVIGPFVPKPPSHPTTEGDPGTGNPDPTGNVWAGLR